MAKTVFDKILDTTTGPKSYDWYQKQVRGMTVPGARALINQGKATLRPKYGVMNLFAYDPKHKATHYHIMIDFHSLCHYRLQKVGFTD